MNRVFNCGFPMDSASHDDGATDAAFLASAAAAVRAAAVAAPGLNAVRTMERTKANDQTLPLISMVSVKARK